MSTPRGAGFPVVAALALAGLLTACAAPAPTTGPTRTPAAAGSSSVTGAISEDGLRTGLAMLAEVTDATTGYRSAGSPEFDAATDRVAAALREAGWEVSEDAFTAPVFADDGASTLEAGDETYGAGDVTPLIFAPAAEVTGPIVAIDWVPGSTDRTGKGCQVADYGDLPDGAIVLVRIGPCYRRDQVLAAQAAGAAGRIRQESTPSMQQRVTALMRSTWSHPSRAAHWAPSSDLSAGGCSAGTGCVGWPWPFSRLPGQYTSPGGEVERSWRSGGENRPGNISFPDCRIEEPKV